ncbi:MAG: enoyl-CoA hydratase/isomerase family protein [Planctomycetes bacterium]|nr:enoyl-CoA hydratase/isomerase family protein [Planctomycetota bacterium]
MPQLVTLESSEPVVRLTLKRPEARNALSMDLLSELLAALHSLRTTRAHILVLTGEGKSFCAGMDLKAVVGHPGDALKLLSTLAEVTCTMRKLPMVSIARVQGAAIGGGCGLACVCDLALTHADAKLGYPEVDLGVCPAVVAPWLVKKIGPGPARRVLLSGGLMSGTEAHRIGIADSVYPDVASLDAAVEETVRRLSAGGPHALRATKELLNQLDGSLDDSAVRQGAELSARIVNLPETQAILKAKFGL